MPSEEQQNSFSLFQSMYIALYQIVAGYPEHSSFLKKVDFCVNHAHETPCFSSFELLTGCCLPSDYLYFLVVVGCNVFLAILRSLKLKFDKL